MSSTCLVEPEDWLYARRTRANVLLDGVYRVEEVEAWLGVHPDDPVTVWRPGECLLLPPVAWRGTLLLHHVEALTEGEQQLLLAWTAVVDGHTWVVSTTRTGLWALVEAGVFHDALYYRLSIVRATVAASLDQGVPALEHTPSHRPSISILGRTAEGPANQSDKQRNQDHERLSQHDFQVRVFHRRAGVGRRSCSAAAQDTSTS